MQWKDQKLNVIKCGMAIAKANLMGKEVPNQFYSAMSCFTADEIEAIETYVYYVSAGLAGADYLSPEEMEEKLEERDDDI